VKKAATLRHVQSSETDTNVAAAGVAMVTACKKMTAHWTFFEVRDALVSHRMPGAHTQNELIFFAAFS